MTERLLRKGDEERVADIEADENDADGDGTDEERTLEDIIEAYSAD